MACDCALHLNPYIYVCLKCGICNWFFSGEDPNVCDWYLLWRMDLHVVCFPLRGSVCAMCHVRCAMCVHGCHGVWAGGEPSRAEPSGIPPSPGRSLFGDERRPRPRRPRSPMSSLIATQPCPTPRSEIPYRQPYHFNRLAPLSYHSIPSFRLPNLNLNYRFLLTKSLPVNIYTLFMAENIKLISENPNCIWEFLIEY